MAVLVCLCALISSASVRAQERQVSFAGVAYSGAEHSIKERFRFSMQYDEALKRAGDSLSKLTMRAIEQQPSRQLKVTPGLQDELKSRDQVLVVSLVLNSETVSVEQFGEVHKLFVLVRGSALFFDFKSMTVVRSYPLSFAYVDNFRGKPSDAEVLQRVKLAYEGAGGKPGIYGRFASALATANVPQQTPRFLQVKNVSLPQEMVAFLPQFLKGDKAIYETWAADLIGEAISSRVGVPIVPYAKGYAVGRVMAMKLADGDVYNLQLPDPDYVINVDFKGLKKVKYSESGAGTSFIYGTFADIRIEEPLTNTVYLKTALKNAEVKVVPASQTQVDDFPAFDDSINGLFLKLADAVAGKGNTWAKAAAGAQDIEAQLLKTKDLMNLCK